MKKSKLKDQLAEARRDAIVRRALERGEAARLKNFEARSEEVAIRELATRIRTLLDQSSSLLAQFDMKIKRRFASSWDELRERDGEET